jgi:hypothetical protein
MPEQATALAFIAGKINLAPSILTFDGGNVMALVHVAIWITAIISTGITNEAFDKQTDELKFTAGLNVAMIFAVLAAVLLHTVLVPPTFGLEPLLSAVVGGVTLFTFALTIAAYAKAEANNRHETSLFSIFLVGWGLSTVLANYIAFKMSAAGGSRPGSGEGPDAESARLRAPGAAIPPAPQVVPRTRSSLT